MTTVVDIYSSASEQFVEAAKQMALAVEPWVVFVDGHGRELSTFTTSLSEGESTKCLVVLSGVHGVEGGVGSDVQSALIRERLTSRGVDLFLIHGVNPYGMAYGRRANEHNVDINRNFVDFDGGAPTNRAYLDYAGLITPDWTKLPDTTAAIAGVWQWIGQIGMQEAQNATTSGQYGHPNGLFYGGHAPTRSREVVEQVFRGLAQKYQEIVVFDLHSGLGGRGEVSLIHEGGTFEMGQAMCPELLAPGGALSSVLSGTLCAGIAGMLGERVKSAIVMEAGTMDPVSLLATMQRELWATLHLPADSSQRSSATRDMLNAFYPDDEEWRARVRDRMVATIRNAIGTFGSA